MDVEEAVRQKYGKAALRAVACDGGCSCGSNVLTGIAQAGRASHEIYDAGDTTGIPAAAIAASLGCGNPAALAQLKEGETVLDLGSGGGIDVFVSARRVGPGGKAYGLDMTDEMLALACENQRQAGIDNVEFLKGRIESIPLPDSSVDVVISNCVLNLSTDKSQVLREAFRVLKPGGRFAVSDVVLCGEIPSLVCGNPQLWTGCLAGAMQEEEYKAGLIEAGFVEPAIEPTRIFQASDVREFLSTVGEDAIALAGELDGKVMSAAVRAAKPAAGGATSMKGHAMPKIQILGTGCARCKQLTANTEKAVQGLGIQAEIEKVTEIKEILKFQILMTPGLAINGKVKSAGRVPAPEEIRAILLEEGGN